MSLFCVCNCKLIAVCMGSKNSKIMVHCLVAAYILAIVGANYRDRESDYAGVGELIMNCCKFVNDRNHTECIHILKSCSLKRKIEIITSHNLGHCCEQFSAKSFASGRRSKSSKKKRDLDKEILGHEPFVKLHLRGTYSRNLDYTKQVRTKLAENSTKELDENKLKAKTSATFTSIMTENTKIKIRKDVSWKVFLTKHYYRNKQGQRPAVNVENWEPSLGNSPEGFI